jgi:hypothetical protein
MPSSTQTREFVVAPGEGNHVWSLNHLTTLKAGGSDTNGAFGLLEVLVDRNGEPAQQPRLPPPDIPRVVEATARHSCEILVTRA